jgi:hypothetical protein
MNLFHWMTLLFIALKLTGHIDWHWLWVLSPVIALFIIALLVQGYNALVVWSMTPVERELRKLAQSMRNRDRNI